MEKLILYYNTPDGRDQTDFGPGVYLAIALPEVFGIQSYSNFTR